MTIHQVDIQEQQNRSKEELLEHIPAIHVMSELPTNDELEVGALTARKQNKETPSFRITNHFSLGDMVPEHRNGWTSWEKKKYALVLPLKALYESGRLLNISTYDTYLLGNLKLSSATILVLPQGEQPPSSATEIFYYDPNTTTIRQAIQQVLEKHQMWQFKMTDTTSSTAPAYWHGLNVNTPDFFRPLMDNGIAFGSHIQGEVMGIAQSFGSVDSMAQQLGNDSFAITAEERKLRKHILHLHIEKLRHYAATLENPQSQLIFDQIKRIEEWYPKQELRAISRMLNRIMTGIRRAVTPEYQKKVQQSMGDFLFNINIEELKNLLKVHPEFLQRESSGRLYFTYSLNRLFMLGIDNSSEPQQALQLLEQNISAISPIQLEHQIFEQADKLDKNDRRFILIFQLLNRNSIRETLKKRGWSFPDRDLQDINDIKDGCPYSSLKKFGTEDFLYELYLRVDYEFLDPKRYQSGEN